MLSELPNLEQEALFLKEFVSGERDEMHSDIKSQSPMQVLDLETQAAEGKRALFQG